MSHILVTAAGLTVAVVLGAAGVAHFRQRDLAYVLRAHGLLSISSIRLVAATLPPLECSLAVFVGVALIRPSLARTAGFAAAALFAAFALYLAVLRRSWRNDPAASGLTCGCGAGSSQLNGATITRAGLLAALSLLVGLLGGGDPIPFGHLALGTAFSVTLIVFVTWLPSIFASPSEIARLMTRAEVGGVT